jgi:hypothetical protein
MFNKTIEDIVKPFTKVEKDLSELIKRESALSVSKMQRVTKLNKEIDDHEDAINEATGLLKKVSQFVGNTSS